METDSIRDSLGRLKKGAKIALGNKLPYIPRPLAKHNFHRETITKVLEGFSPETLLEYILSLPKDKQLFIYMEFAKLENHKIDSEFKQKLELLKLQPEEKDTNEVYIVDITEDLVQPSTYSEDSELPE